MNTQKNNTRPNTRTVTRTGVLRVHPRGFGFVDPANGGESVHVPGHLLRGLLDGDTVKVRLDPAGTRARSVQLVTRSRTQVFGTIIETPRGAALRLDPGIGNGDVPITGTVEAVYGTAAIATLDEQGKARIVSVHGDELEEDAVALRMLLRHQLPLVEERNTTQGAQVAPAPDDAGRRDMTGQLVITIDDDSSQDLDDALAAEAAEDGSLRVWVHIADVAQHVLPGSMEDLDAQSWPTSIYLPGNTRHMLPPALSADRLSLLPGVERDTMCVEMRIDPTGAVRAVDVYPARIRSAARLSYRTVAAVLDGREGAVKVTPEIRSLLQLLRSAATRLGISRTARGGIDAFRADHDSDADGAKDAPAHLLIERLMVAANESVATFLADRGAPALWRNHEAIDDERAEEIEALAASFGVHAGLGRPVSPRALAALVAQISQSAHAPAFFDALIAVLGPARYDTVNTGHFGLGSDGYLHFTSPLRRLPDLLVHRIVKSYLAGQRDVGVLTDGLSEAAARANDVFARASRAENDARRALALAELKRGQRRDGVVISVRKNAARVRLDDIDVIGVADVGRDAPAPGAEVKVRIKDLDPIAGTLSLSLETGRPHASRRGRETA